MNKREHLAKEFLLQHIRFKGMSTYNDNQIMVDLSFDLASKFLQQTGETLLNTNPITLLSTVSRQINDNIETYFAKSGIKTVRDLLLCSHLANRTVPTISNSTAHSFPDSANQPALISDFKNFLIASEISQGSIPNHITEFEELLDRLKQKGFYVGMSNDRINQVIHEG